MGPRIISTKYAASTAGFCEALQQGFDVFVLEWTSYKSGVTQQRTTLQKGRQEKGATLQAVPADGAEIPPSPHMGLMLACVCVHSSSTRPQPVFCEFGSLWLQVPPSHWEVSVKSRLDPQRVSGF